MSDDTGFPYWCKICLILCFPVIGVWWVKGWACDSDVLFNLLFCFIGLGACHGVHVLLKTT